jgi:hypothetical protein
VKTPRRVPRWDLDDRRSKEISTEGDESERERERERERDHEKYV